MIQTLRDRLFADHGLAASALRLDLIHPEVSGNKWFKLKYHLEYALSQHKKGIVSFGGAYSNHLTALAFACKQCGLSSTGIIRGDEPQLNNPSIRQMKDLGMQLIFTDRKSYRDKENIIQEHLSANPDDYAVPEGGQSELGIAGAAEIMQPEHRGYSHVICSVGTGTTIAGLVNGSSAAQQIIGISALKISDKNKNGLLQWMQRHASGDNYRLVYDYHFGGYAKKTDELISFMNTLFAKEKIPTDFVYTGKLFYAAYDLARQHFFQPGSTILIVHSGGLQGNRSLAKGILDF